MSRYYFLVGATPALSKLELEMVVGQKPEFVGGDKLLAFELESDLEAQAIFKRSGSIVKLYGVLTSFPLPDDEQSLLRQLADVMAPHAAANGIDFGFAEFGQSGFEQFSLQEIKVALRELGIKSRYLKQPGTGLPAAVLLHQTKVQDWCLVYEAGTVFVARTLSVQDIDDWTVRDRYKPYADRKKGMLPPKLARIMVNIAAANTPAETLSKQQLLDPFCGSGTILLESAMIGLAAHGSDLDKTAVRGTLSNINWFAAEYQSKVKLFVQAADATNLQLPFPDHSIDYLVTEPFLGKPTPKLDDLANIFKGLEKLYLGSFKHWCRWLKNDARVVVVFPYVQSGKRTFSLENLFDKLKPFGYTLTVDPVLYARPKAVVQRQIIVFTWKQSK